MNTTKNYWSILFLIASLVVIQSGNAQQEGYGQSSNPLMRLKQLSQRVKRKFDPQRNQPQLDPETRRNDLLLHRAAQNQQMQQPYQRVNRIGIDGTANGASTTGYYQQPTPRSQSNAALPSPGEWPGDSVVDNPIPNAPPIISNDQLSSNQYRQMNQQVSSARTTGHFEQRWPNAMQSQHLSNQSIPPNGNSNQGTSQPFIPFEDPGILGVQGNSNAPRYRHFTSRIPASERVVMLEDELAMVEKKLNARIVENEILQGKLDENEKLLVEIQASIDEAIAQLTTAADTNQNLRERIVQLETEKQQQKATYQKLMDDVRGQLNQMLQAEFAGK